MSDVLLAGFQRANADRKIPLTYSNPDKRLQSRLTALWLATWFVPGFVGGGFVDVIGRDKTGPFLFSFYGVAVVAAVIATIAMHRSELGRQARAQRLANRWPKAKADAGPWLAVLGLLVFVPVAITAWAILPPVAPTTVIIMLLIVIACRQR